MFVGKLDDGGGENNRKLEKKEEEKGKLHGISGVSRIYDVIMSV